MKTDHNIRERLIDGAAFLFLAIPGLAGMLYGAFLTIVSKDSHEIGIGGLLMIASSPVILAGVRKFHEPLYLLVILSIPAGLVLTPNSSEKGLPGFMVGFAALVTLGLVRKYYRNRKTDRTEADSLPGE